MFKLATITIVIFFPKKKSTYISPLGQKIFLKEGRKGYN
jgi:hypothetical protein